MSFKLFSTYCLVSLLQVVTAAPLSTLPKRHPGVTHSPRLEDTASTKDHSLTFIILISFLCVILVGIIILVIVLYFCCWQTPDPGGRGEGLSKKGSKPGSKASHALSYGAIQEAQAMAMAIEENGSGPGDDDGGAEPMDSGGGHDGGLRAMSHGSVGGSRRVNAASSNKKPLTATSKRQIVGGAKRKEKKGNKAGDGANREKHPKVSRHHNASKQAKQQQKKGHKKKRVAGKGGHPNKPAKAADPQESQLLYNEGLGYYKQFLKSVHSVKSVSQYFDGKGGQHKAPVPKASVPKVPVPKHKQPTDAQDSQILYNEGYGYYKQFLKSVHSVKSVSQYFDPKQQQRHK